MRAVCPAPVERVGLAARGRLLLAGGTVRVVTSRPGAEPREIVDFVPRPEGAAGPTMDAVISSLPVPAEMAGGQWGGDEEWVSTLPDPHDATITETP